MGFNETLDSMTRRVAGQNTNARLKWAQQMESDMHRKREEKSRAYANAGPFVSPELWREQQERDALQGPALESAELLSLLSGKANIHFDNTVGSGGPINAKARRGAADIHEASSDQPKPPPPPEVRPPPAADIPYDEDIRWQQNMEQTQVDRMKEDADWQERSRARYGVSRGLTGTDTDRLAALKRGFRF